MMVPSKFRKSKPYLALAVSVVFATTTTPPISAQTQTPPSSQSPAPTTPKPSGTRHPKQAFGGQVAVFLGHETWAATAVFSPNGRQVLTTSNDSTVRLWDSQGQILAILRGHKFRVNSVVFSPDNQRILTASGDSTVRLWDSHGHLVAVLQGHESWVNSAIFSPDGEQILTASLDKTARLWDRQGNLIAVLRGHESDVKRAVFSPDGRQILTVSDDITARLWDRRGNLLAVLRGHEKGVGFYSAVFSPDGRQILTAIDDKSPRLWDHQGRLLAVLKGHEDIVTSAIFSPDSQQILTTGFDRTVRLWNRQGHSLATLQPGHSAIVDGAVFSPNGQQILTFSRDNTVRLLDRQGHLLAVLRGHKDIVTSAVFSSDGRQILTTSNDKTVRLWVVSDVLNNQTEQVAALQAFQGNVSQKNAQLTIFKGHEHIIGRAVFSPNGQRILTSSGDKTARLWNLQGHLLAVLKGHESAIISTTFSPDDQQIVTASADKTARLWDLEGNLLAVLQGHEDWIASAIFSPDSQQILTASGDKTARLWDRKGNLLAILHGHGGAVRSAVFSSDNRHILTASNDKTARLWDRQGSLLAVFQGHQDKINRAVFSPDGQYILTVSRDVTARLWDRQGNLLVILSDRDEKKFDNEALPPDIQKLLTTLPIGTLDIFLVDGQQVLSPSVIRHIYRSAAFSSDGQKILTTSGITARLWDRQGNLLTTLRGHKHLVTIAIFSPNGQHILTASKDNTIRLWDHQGNLLAVLQGHESQINNAEFSPDGRQILTVSWDQTVRLWDVKTAIALQAEETAAQRNSQANVSNKNAPQAEAALQAAIQLNQQGTVESRQQALQKLDEALKLYRTDNNLAKAAHTLRLIGNIRADLGQFQAALDAYTQALPLSRQSGAKAEEAAILNSLGQLYTNLADSKTALDYHTQALPLLYQLNDKGGAAATFTNIGDIHADTNQWQQAQDAYTQALIISRPAGDLAAEATALAGIGRTYMVAKDWGTALNAYQQALIITRHLNDKIHESTILNQTGKIHAALGNKATALKHYTQALRMSQEVGNRLGEATTFSNMAGFYEEQGNSAKAIESYQQSIALTESIRGDIRLEQLKSSFVSERIDTYSRLINLLAQRGDFTAAFNYAERAKARAFLDQLANGQIDLRAGADAQLLQQAQDLSQQIDAIERQLTTLRSRPKDQWDQTAISAASTQLVTLRQADDRLLIQIQLQSPAAASLVTVDVAPLVEIQRLLQPDTTLVEYFVTGDRTVAFILTRNSFNTVSLNISREDLVKTITNLRDFSDLSDKVPAEFQQLHQVLIAPLQAYLKTSRLIIVPHDSLHYLPFAALTDGNRYLGDRYVLSFLPSANVLRFLPASKPSPVNTLLALGDPMSAEQGGLSSARTEVEAIAALFNTTPFVGKDATETRLRSQAPTANILHLAVHGKVDPINPRSSALYLTADDKNNGRLEVGEIYGLDLTRNTNLVVLSACQTGIGQQSRGDEIVGLNRAFLYAGTPTVLSSLWNVDDEPTALLMKQFYTYLRTGSDPATALQQAQQAFRQQNPDYTHPYFWSAFSITGRADLRKR
ncbi:MAG: hypothetical protein B0A82_24490 [Alkalinema sp. CACIAM 70d]|nr:MAG: hypothetical protein B0A82_24490 [Alkalinema sp. CACIAM 70d]